MLDAHKYTILKPFTNIVEKLHSVPQDVPQDVPQGVPQDVPQGGTQGGTQDGTQGDTQDVPQDVPQDETLDLWIEKQVIKNPKITTEELAALSRKTSKTIKRHIAKLPHITYIGSGYSGYWKVEKK